MIPAAFKSPKLQESWGDIHYEKLDQMELENWFMTYLDPLVVVKRTGGDNGIGYTHAATKQLHEQTVGNGIEALTALSKHDEFNDPC